MAVLISCQSLVKSYGTRMLFENISLNLHDGERMGLIGPNGSGKSTLLKIIAGQEQPDRGSLSLRRQLRLSYLPQIETFGPEENVSAIVKEALSDSALDDHERDWRVEQVLTQVGFEPEQFFATYGSLSGGWHKRVSIARALATEPELMLLDEPTNHLDLEGILWLEKLLSRAPFAFLLVSHDRYFLEKATNRVVELNACYPEGSFGIKGNYSEFLVQRENFIKGQLQTQQSLESVVRREIEWLRRGPPARTTKSRARIDEAGRLINELSEVKQRNNQGAAIRIDFNSSDRQTNKLLVLKNLNKSLGERLLVENLSLMLTPGSKVALVGPNGSGKTTLMRMMAGTLAPDGGTITRADLLRVVYFDQHREQLDPEMSLRRALAPSSGDSVTFRGQVIHISSWARRFLFRQEQLDMPVRNLSGGEQARVQIARLMLCPADLLLLDEPTNDLDIPSLEVLEESLAGFPGAIVMVTHDRFMLQRLEADILGLDGQGEVRSFLDYAQWEKAHAESLKPAARKAKTEEPKPAVKSAKRLSYKEQLEWDQMEALILKEETTVATLEKGLNDPVLTADSRRLQEHCDGLAKAQSAVEKLYHRWQELEEKMR